VARMELEPPVTWKPEQLVGREPVVGRRRLEGDLSEVHFQLFGYEHGLGRVRPLAHFDLLHDERHAPVPADADVCVRREDIVCRGLGVRFNPAEKIESDQKPRDADLHEGAA
jgi:hypothetical protein